MTNSIVTNTSEYAANKDKFLEMLQSRIESALEDLEYYKGM